MDQIINIGLYRILNAGADPMRYENSTVKGQSEYFNQDFDRKP